MILTWGIDILFEKLTPETEEWVWKTLFTLCLWEWKFHTKLVFILSIFSGNPQVDAFFIIGLY